MVSPAVPAFGSSLSVAATAKARRAGAIGDQRAEMRVFRPLDVMRASQLTALPRVSEREKSPAVCHSVLERSMPVKQGRNRGPTGIARPLPAVCVNWFAGRCESCRR